MRRLVPLVLFLPLACAAPAPDGPSRLEQRWELGDVPRSELFRPVAHGQNYLLPARWSSQPNQDLADETARASAQQPRELQEIEVKFQLSLKARLLRLPADTSLWLGYTQQSNWQAYDFDASSPFRESNYEPELIWSIPLERAALGWHLRMLNLAFVHHSNGRGDPLSRSWDRLYAQLGLERGNLALLLRPWLILGEDEQNTDIEDYLGYGDLAAIWSPPGHVLSLVLRNNLQSDDNHGSLLADWSWGHSNGPRFFVQLFTGYGESLIDYDHNQTTIGVGVIVTDRL